MNPPASVSTPDPQSFADYMRAENAKDRVSDGLDGDGAPLPEAEPITAAESAQPDPEPEPEPDPEPIAAQPETAEAKPKRDTVQARIDKAVKAQRDAERRADAAEARAREVEARTTPERPVETPKATVPADAPKFDDFASDPDPLSAFINARTEWAATQALTKAATEAAARAQDAEIEAKVRRSDTDGRAQFPDWEEVVEGDFARTFQFPLHVIAAIRDSDQSAALRYYLASHPDECRALATDPPVKSLVTLGMLAARLTPASHGSGAPMVAHSKAKPLTKPLRGSTPSASSDAAPDPDKTPLSDWIRIHNAADRRRAQELRGA